MTFNLCLLNPHLYGERNGRWRNGEQEHQNFVLASFRSVFHLKASDEASLCVQFTEQGLLFVMVESQTQMVEHLL